MNEAMKTIVEAVKPVAEKIGEGASHLYEVYTRQMFAEGIATIIAIIVAWIVTVALVSFFLRNLNLFLKETEDERYRSMYTKPHEVIALATGVIALIAAVVTIIGTIAESQTAITKIINPEYHAIERILDQVKGEK